MVDECNECPSLQLGYVLIGPMNQISLSHSLHERCLNASNGQDLLVPALCTSLQISPLQAFPSSDSGIWSSELESGEGVDCILVIVRE